MLYTNSFILIVKYLFILQTLNDPVFIIFFLDGIGFDLADALNPGKTRYQQTGIISVNIIYLLLYLFLHWADTKLYAFTWGRRDHDKLIDPKLKNKMDLTVINNQ